MKFTEKELDYPGDRWLDMRFLNKDWELYE
jgi:hypothetical protein